MNRRSKTFLSFGKRGIWWFPPFQNWSLHTHDTGGTDNILILWCCDLSNCFNNHGANFFLFMALCYFLCRALSGLKILGVSTQGAALGCIMYRPFRPPLPCNLRILPWKGYTYIAQGSALGWPPTHRSPERAWHFFNPKDTVYHFVILFNGWGLSGFIPESPHIDGYGIFLVTILCVRTRVQGGFLITPCVKCG